MHCSTAKKGLKILQLFDPWGTWKHLYTKKKARLQLDQYHCPAVCVPHTSAGLHCPHRPGKGKRSRGLRTYACCICLSKYPRFLASSEQEGLISALLPEPFSQNLKRSGGPVTRPDPVLAFLSIGNATPDSSHGQVWPAWGSQPYTVSLLCFFLRGPWEQRERFIDRPSELAVVHLLESLIFLSTKLAVRNLNPSFVTFAYGRLMRGSDILKCHIHSWTFYIVRCLLPHNWNIEPETKRVCSNKTDPGFSYS